MPEEINKVPLTEEQKAALLISRKNRATPVFESAKSLCGHSFTYKDVRIQIITMGVCEKRGSLNVWCKAFNEDGSRAMGLNNPYAITNPRTHVPHPTLKRNVRVNLGNREERIDVPVIIEDHCAALCAELGNVIYRQVVRHRERIAKEAEILTKKRGG